MLINLLGVVHGDIKPQNVLVSESETDGLHSKVTDFGFSTFGLEETDLVRLSGTKGWVHPDQYPHGCRRLTAQKLDIYSLGMLSMWLFLYDVQGYPSDERILELQQSGKMVETAMRLTDSSRYSDHQKQLLGSLFANTLVHDHDQRFTGLQVLELMEADPAMPPKPVVDIDFTFLDFITAFQIAPAAFTLSFVDYRVRSSIVTAFLDLMDKEQNSLIFKPNATLQLALCYKLGFGVAQSEDECLRLLAVGNHAPEVLSEQLQLLQEHSDLVFNQDFDRVWAGSLLRVVDLAEVYRENPFKRDQAFLVEECREHWREMLQVSSVLGESHPLVLNLKSTLASLLLAKGDWIESCNLFEEVLRDEKATFRPTRETERDLCVIYTHLGRFEEALQLAEQTCEAYQAELGPEHAESLESRSLLTFVCMEMDDFDRAKKEAAANFQALVSLRGPTHPATLLQLHRMGQIDYELGHFDSAKRLVEDVIRHREDLLGSDHVDTLSSKQLLGAIMQALGHFDRAADLEREILEGYERALGSHPDTISCKASLSQTLCDSGDWDEAEQLSSEAFNESLKTLGVGHPTTIESSIAHMSALLEKSKGRQAKEVGERVLDPAIKALGPKHSLVAGVMNQLGLAYSKTEELDKAESVLTRALAIREPKLGTCHPDTLTTKGLFVSVLGMKGEYERAAELGEDLLQAQVKLENDGAGDPMDTILAMVNLASTYWDAKDFVKCKTLEVDAFQRSMEVLGEDHAITLTTAVHLAKSLAQLGELEEALHYAFPAMESSIKFKGMDHEETISAISQVAEIYEKQGKLVEAKRLFEKALGALEEHFDDDHWLAAEIKESLEKYC